MGGCARQDAGRGLMRMHKICTVSPHTCARVAVWVERNRKRNRGRPDRSLNLTASASPTPKCPAHRILPSLLTNTLPELPLAEVVRLRLPAGRRVVCLFTRPAVCTLRQQRGTGRQEARQRPQRQPSTCVRAAQAAQIAAAGGGPPNPPFALLKSAGCCCSCPAASTCASSCSCCVSRARMESSSACSAGLSPEP